MKKYVTIAIFIFWAAVVSLLVSGLVFYQNSAGRGNPAAGESQIDSVKKDLSGKILDAAEVAKHNSAGDCWMILSGKVYNFTSYETIHPGGMGEIAQACGTDGTALFQTKDSRGVDHSAYAYSLLANYYLGDLGQAVTAPAVAAAAPQAPATPDQAASALPVAGTKTQTKTAAAVVLSATEVAKHSRATDCYLIISGKVYDVTSYLAAHPGGAAVISQACGKDGTSLFATKGGSGNDHSNYAYSLLGKYYVGDLGKPPSNSAVVPPAKAPAGTVKPPAVPIPVPPVNQPSGSVVVLSAAEVAKHNSRTDCWMIISGNVYSLASYMDAHPGGVSMILNSCGADGTTMFETKGGGGNNHSSGAYSLLANYLVGSLGSQTTSTQIDQAAQQAQTTSQNQPQGGREDEEDDDD